MNSLAQSFALRKKKKKIVFAILYDLRRDRVLAGSGEEIKGSTNLIVNYKI